MGGRARGAQQGVHLGVGQASRLAVALGAHGTDVEHGAGWQGAGAARPAAEPAQGVEPAVDRGGPEASGAHVLTVGGQLVPGQVLKDERAVMDCAVPGGEVVQVVAVAAQRRRRQVIARQAGEERRHPAWLAGCVGGRCAYCTQCHPPR